MLFIIGDDFIPKNNLWKRLLKNCYYSNTDIDIFRENLVAPPNWLYPGRFVSFSQFKLKLLSFLYSLC